MITRFCNDSDFYNDFDEVSISMGEYEESLADALSPDDPFFDEDERGCPPLAEPKSQPTATIWVTRDNQRIPVREMSDQHLINTIRYLRRLYGDQLDDELQDFEEVDTVPAFATMLAEAEKRGLEL